MAQNHLRAYDLGMPTPCRPGMHFNSLDDLLADVELLHAAGWEKCGQWSLAMMVDHLAKGINGMLDGGMPYVPRPFRWIARAVVQRMVRKQKYPGIKIPVPSSMKPAPQIAEQSAMIAVRSAIARVQQLQGPTVQTHPFGALSVHDFQQMILLHAAHHLAYLRPLQRANAQM